MRLLLCALLCWSYALYAVPPQATVHTAMRLASAGEPQIAALLLMPLLEGELTENEKLTITYDIATLLLADRQYQDAHDLFAALPEKEPPQSTLPRPFWIALAYNRTTCEIYLLQQQLTSSSLLSEGIENRIHLLRKNLSELTTSFQAKSIYPSIISEYAAGKALLDERLNTIELLFKERQGEQRFKDLALPEQIETLRICLKGLITTLLPLQSCSPESPLLPEATWKQLNELYFRPITLYYQEVVNSLTPDATHKQVIAAYSLLETAISQQSCPHILLAAFQLQWALHLTLTTDYASLIHKILDTKVAAAALVHSHFRPASTSLFYQDAYQAELLRDIALASSFFTQSIAHTLHEQLLHTFKRAGEGLSPWQHIAALTAFFRNRWNQEWQEHWPALQSSIEDQSLYQLLIQEPNHVARVGIMAIQAVERFLADDPKATLEELPFKLQTQLQVALVASQTLREQLLYMPQGLKASKELGTWSSLYSPHLSKEALAPLRIAFIQAWFAVNREEAFIWFCNSIANAAEAQNLTAAPERLRFIATMASGVLETLANEKSSTSSFLATLFKAVVKTSEVAMQRSSSDPQTTYSALEAIATAAPLIEMISAPETWRAAPPNNSIAQLYAMQLRRLNWLSTSPNLVMENEHPLLQPTLELLEGEQRGMSQELARLGLVFAKHSPNKQLTPLLRDAYTLSKELEKMMPFAQNSWSENYRRGQEALAAILERLVRLMPPSGGGGEGEGEGQEQEQKTAPAKPQAMPIKEQETPFGNKSPRQLPLPPSPQAAEPTAAKTKEALEELLEMERRDRALQHTTREDERVQSAKQEKYPW